MPTEALFPEAGLDASSAGNVGFLRVSCSSNTPGCSRVREGLLVVVEATVTKQRRRGRPWNVFTLGKPKERGVVINEVAEILRVEVLPEKGYSLIHLEARGSDRTLTRARRYFLIFKELGVVPTRSEEEAIQSLANHLITNHPRLYEVL